MSDEALSLRLKGPLICEPTQAKLQPPPPSLQTAALPLVQLSGPKLDAVPPVSGDSVIQPLG